MTSAPILAAGFLFNLGQGVLRPSLPLYLQRVFAAKYQMVTLIPVVFGAGRWLASLPTGYLLHRLGRRPLMAGGLLLVAASDVASVLASVYGAFLALRGLAGVGWAMFATVATTAMVDVRTSDRRGRAVSLLMVSETLGLLLGNAGGGWLYQRVGVASPFLFEAGCMLLAIIVLAGSTRPAVEPRSTCSGAPRERPHLAAVLRTPGVLIMSLTNAILVAVQTGLLVFLFPLYLANRGNVSPEIVGVLVSLSVLGRLVALGLVGTISDRSSRLRLLIRGLLAYAALLGSLTFLMHPVVLGVWSLAIGSAAGLVMPLPTALVGDQVSPPLHGVAIGWLRTVTDTGQILGSLVMGTLADAGGLPTPFLVGAGLLVAMAWQCRRTAAAISRSAPPGGEAHDRGE